MTIDYTKPYQPPPQPPPPPPPAPGDVPPSKGSACGKIALIGCGVIFVGGLLFIGGIFYFVFHLIKDSEVYREGLMRAQASPEVTAILGTPIESGWWVTGKIDLSDNGGRANITYPIEGPKGKATIHIVASRPNSAWVYDRIRVTPSDSSKAPIDLTR